MESCETCRFWQDADPTETEKDRSIGSEYSGWCKRHAPRPLIVIGARDEGLASEHVVWPLTIFRDWCGEFKPNCETK